MKTFKEFPEELECPICKTSKAGECFLIEVDGTEDGNNCEAQPVHKDCLLHDNYRYLKEMGIIYFRV